MQLSAISRIRSLSPNEEIDYNFLTSCLKDYKAPRDVITRLLQNKDLIRVKKGIYVFGEEYRKRLISLEVLANQIYGPSYVSREYALHFYGLIPENVQEITSMSLKKNKVFNTGLGVFSYKYLNVARFHLGVDFIRLSDTHGALIATKEKALVDFLYTKKEYSNITSDHEIKRVLLEDYRLDQSILKKFDLNLLENITNKYNSKLINSLSRVVKFI